MAQRTPDTLLNLDRTGSFATPEYPEMMELMELRQQHISNIFCSQMDSSDWVPRLGSEVIVAESICDRFVHHAFRIVVHGDSMRKLNGIAAREA